MYLKNNPDFRVEKQWPHSNYLFNPENSIMNQTRISSSRVQVKTAEKNLMCFDGPNTKFKTPCLMMDPLRFENLGPSKDMSFLCTHVFRWTQKPHVF